ncbi:AAA family ATPase [Pseudomonas sp. UL073]|uniref:AAA family ATPase n=1 Tax=Zestomonas insulae TaxID=2809017 RepID=A0ABS2IKW0_9GAMM|nr:AAA family ATPase [Pseudomonas insulae]MBM7062828.1 AAA family ATPase [Pseudomonas insulae]
MAHYQGGPLDLLLSRLEGAKRHGERYVAKCPAHQDKSPSLSLSRGDDGRALVHCYAGCELRDVMAAVGLEMRDLFPENLSQEQRQQYRRAKLEAELRFERLIVEAAKGEAKVGTLSDQSAARLALAKERTDQIEGQLARLSSQPEPCHPMLVEVALGDVMSTNLQPARHAVNPWMPRRHVTLFGGHGGIGKSSLALAIGAHVACGLPFAGLEVEQSPVLFVSLEDEASIVRLRLRRIIEAYRLPAAQVLAGLRLLDGTQTFAALMTEGDGFNAEPIFTPAFREMSDHVGGAGLIVIDNASDAFDANENSRRTVRAFVRGLVDIARKHDAAVVLLAHIDKAAARGNASGNSYSGSTAWHNSARSRLALLEENGRILLAHEKANLSARAEPVPVTFVDGVPLPEVGVQGEGLTAEDFDQAELIRAMKAAHDAGISVPSSTAPGAHSAMKALESLPEYGQAFRGKVGGQRAARAITALIRNRRIRRVEYKTPQRKTRERLELVELREVTSEQVENALTSWSESAPRHPPITPQHIGAAHGDACAGAPNLNGAAPNTIGAISAREDAQEKVALPERSPASMESTQ